MKKELIKMSREERVGVSISCDSFFISTNKSKTSQGIYKILHKELGLHRRYNNEIWMIITMVGKSLSSGCEGSQLPLQTSVYKTANENRDNKLNRDRVKVVIDKMESLGYVDIFVGFKDLVNKVSLTTCVIFHESLISLFPETPKNVFGKNITVNEMVEVKDSETKKPITQLSKVKGVSGSKNFMLSYNNLLEIHDIRYKGRKCFVKYKQIFADDLDGGGRIYCFGVFQTMPAYLRKTLTIDGYTCTEVDIVANHISMLYLLQGIKIEESFDCYYIPIRGYAYKEIRSLCKMAVMCLINCETKNKAFYSLMKIIRDDSKSEEPFLDMFPDPDDNEVLYRYVINSLMKLHDKINFFKKGEILWKKLQRLDSRITENIVKTFIKKDEVILNWHDSWVCRYGLQQTLINTVKESWFKVFGTYDNCFLKVEF